MTNKELFLTFFDVESATIIGVNHRNNEAIQLIVNPTEKNKFMEKLPIRLLINVDKRYKRVMSTSDDTFNLFRYLGFTTNEVTNVCREIHQDMGSKKLIVP